MRCWSDLEVGAIKTGMLATADIVDGRRPQAGRRRHGCPLVVDPVMVATSGDALIAPDAVEAVQRALLPLATLITPNLPEAARLLDAKQAATRGRGGRAGQGAARARLPGGADQGRARRGRYGGRLSSTTARACERFARPRVDTPPHAWHRLHAVGGHRGPAGAGRGPARGRGPGQDLRLAGAAGRAATCGSGMARVPSTSCTPSAAKRRRRDGWRVLACNRYNVQLPGWPRFWLMPSWQRTDRIVGCRCW